MAQQTDDNKMKSTQTAVEWIFQKMTEQGTNPYWDMRFIQAKQMEQDRRREDVKIGYNQGYLDAQCNHINDAENYANEIEYLKAKIDDINDEIKRREDKIASLLINGTTDHDITDYIISPFGTPENK